jgi:hypothetical protein
MPCQADEEEMQRPGSPNPVTPTKPPRHDGAGHDDSDSEILLTQSDEEEKLLKKERRGRAYNFDVRSCSSLGHW